MAERAADRVHPERLRQQAVRAFRSVAGREICPEVPRKLRVYNARPDLFAAPDLEQFAWTTLETDVARNTESREGQENAICAALCLMKERYSRELNCRLIAERHPQSAAVSESVGNALEEAAPIVARLVLNSQPAPRVSDRVRLEEAGL
jgi:hypothetical protein